MLPERFMARGKSGLFGVIESTANLRNICAFVVLTALLFALSVVLRFTVPEIGVVPAFMAFSAGLLAVSLAELVIVRKKKGVGNHLKWAVGIGFIAAAVTTTSTMGAAGSILFVFPLLMSVQYCSVLYSLFISAVTVMSTFIPLLLSARLSNYDLNVARLLPGAVIGEASTLEAALGPVLDPRATKVNELLSVFLPMILFVILIAVVTVLITAAIRKSLLQQYHQFQITRE